MLNVIKYFIFCLLFSSFVFAEYLIVKVEVNGSFTVVNIANDDNTDLIYKILLENTWPTCLAFNTCPNGMTESEALETALNNAGILDSYKFIWISNTFYELFTISYVLDNKEEFLRFTGDGLHNLHKNVPYHFTPYSPVERPTEEELLLALNKNRRVKNRIEREFELYKIMYIKEDYIWGDYFGSTNDFAKNLGEKIDSGEIVNPEHAFNDYYLELNDRAKESFFLINSAIVDFLNNYLNILDENFSFLNMPTEEISLLRASLVRRFNQSFEQDDNFQNLKFLSGCGDGVSGFFIDEREEDASFATRFDYAILAEQKSYLENKYPMFRGTNGFQSNFDSALYRGSYKKTYRCRSIAFGSTLFAGFFLDSATRGRGRVSESSACAAQDFQDENTKNGFVININKNNFTNVFGKVDELFFIPPILPIVGIFSCGEYFHPRTILGTKDESLENYWYIAGLLANSKKIQQQISIVSSNNYSPEEMAVRIDDFLNQNGYWIFKK